MADTGKRPKKPEGLEGLPDTQSFPLPLSRTRAKCTVAWAIAGFDPSSGAGVTADLMTFAAHGVFGCSVITALTVQSTRGVFGWQPVGADLIDASLHRLQQDLPFAGMKIGMLGTPEIVRTLGRFLAAVKSDANAQRGPVVFDPVLRSSSGRELYPQAEMATLHTDLLPHVDWITPNWPELALLADQAVTDLNTAEAAARSLMETHPGLHIVATGGDQGDPIDLLVAAGQCAQQFPGQRVDTTSTHGTGCAFSSALLCQLMAGATPGDAVPRAKAYVEGALRAAPGLGSGRGPMGLLWPLLPKQEHS